ncbi:hypothetical protein CBR_g36429 [Chara braunii]|uniref:Uncharacterized protein n=1 Tax=Chara braunii TaxID=69332 RepID=A0A388LL01_CHABU|nr:hypothetical protein CBR_g36429 [Chara braunii]|eukprot:GBG82902.1 hypothetical protein CBR_g36429 [Chara braunii]
MSSRGGNRGKKRDSCEGHTLVAVKRGRHVAKNEKALAEGPSKGSGAREEEWARDCYVAGNDEDFVSDNELEAVRQALVPAQGAVRISEPCPQTAPQPHGGEDVRKGDVIIYVDAGHAARKVQGKVAPQTARAGRSNARTRVTAPPEGQDSGWVQSTPATPRGQTVPEAGGAAMWPCKQASREHSDKMWKRDCICWPSPGESPLPTSVGLYSSFTQAESSIPQHKIKDESQLKAEKDRAITVQSIAWRVIHGWIFKSASSSRGHHSMYKYVLNHVVTDIVRVMWFGENWRTCVSPAVCHITLELDIMLPIWFVGVHIEDRDEDNELACYQEDTVQRLLGAFTSPITLAEGIDGGHVSYDRQRNIAEAIRVLLAATMCLMRMSRDDLRSHLGHFDASLFVQLTVKPMLVSSMHRSFDAHRHITERMEKPAMTLADPPLNIPHWASCGTLLGMMPLFRR